jgi:hypothetical protein
VSTAIERRASQQGPQGEGLPLIKLLRIDLPSQHEGKASAIVSGEASELAKRGLA